MEVINAFVMAFLFSFLGSIPPGTLNLTVLQLGLQHKMDIAVRFAVAAAIVEYPYAWLAITFENVITDNNFIAGNLQLFAGIIMVVLGVLNIFYGTHKTKMVETFHASGFRRGLLLGILNPLALPFWIGVTAYLKSLQWISLSTPFQIQAFLFGICLGAFSLLLLVAQLSKKLLAELKEHILVQRVPGIVLIALGAYALFTFLSARF